MTEPLLTISAFARAVGLSPSALRYYDECGLLPPAEVDPATGYRYYTPRLERRAHMLRRMREVGVPVETMRLVLDGPPEEATEILRGFAARAAESARHAADAVADVVTSLRAEDAPAATVAVAVDGPELAVALRRVRQACSSDPASALGVVVLDVDASTLTVVATDRYWLAAWAMRLDEVQAGRRRIVVPAGEVDGIAPWLARRGTVTLSATSDIVRLLDSEEDRVVPTVADRFPAYRLVLDALPPVRGRATVARDRLVSAMEGESGVVRVVVGQDRVSVSPSDTTEGTHLAATTAGSSITFGFNAELLGGALQTLVGPDATLSFSEPDRAVRLACADQRSHAVLVMPTMLES